MTDTYKAIANGLTEKDGVTCDLTLRGTAIDVSFPAETGFSPSSLPYIGMRVGFGGVDDRYLVLEGTKDDRSFKLLVPDKRIIEDLRAIGAPRPFIDALEQTVAKRGRRSLGRVGIFAALGAMGLVLLIIGWFLFHHGVEKAVGLVPLEWETALGRAAATQLLGEHQVCTNPAVNKAMNEMGTRLIGGLERVPFDFKIRVLDSDEVNAFALPGGYLFVNRGLIDQADDGFEVAGVLAHEIQHAMLRHGIHNVLREAGMALMLQALIGDVGGIEQFLLYNAASLSSMSFSRDQETAADLQGLALMYQSQMDPAGLPRFLEKLAAKEGTWSKSLSLLSTHPASDARVHELNTMIQQRQGGTIQPLNNDFSQLRGLCDPVALTDPDAPI